MPKSSPVSDRRHLKLPRPLIPMTRATTRKRINDANSVLIIGAGLSGLSAGLRLRAAGKDVTIVEAASGVGGRCRTEHLTSAHGDFFADTGATVLTMPQLAESAIASAGINPRDLVLDNGTRWGHTRLAPAYRGEFASGRHITLFSDPDSMHKELRRFATDKFQCRETAPDVTRLIDGYDTHRAWAESMFTLAYEHFLASDFDSLLDVVATPASASSMLRLLSAGAFGRLGHACAQQLQDPELERMFTFQALYVGTAPSKALAVYSVISHMDTSMGVYYPSFSIGDTAEFLAKAFTTAGGTLRLNSPVARLHTDSVSVTNVELASGEKIATDAVISTVDLPITAGWLGRQDALKKITYSPSAVVIQATIPTEVSEQWASQQHHTISFGEQWDQTFEELTAKNGAGKIMSDPSLLITRPACTVPERVETNNGVRYEPISILAPAPNLQSASIDWDVLQQHYVREILDVLEQRGYHGIADNIAIARVDTPTSYAREHQYGAGTPFAAAHTLLQTGPFRSKNYPAFGYNNLVVAGSSTTPGVGVPTAIISGALAARRITGGGVR
ncbi:phytoene desaturase [Corynebacterium sp. 320]|uniref:phytoene desaturase family protein n=1 Tax=Corynebacterium TaxID=1716 RepID=UPI00125CAE2A|nr:MULTISPECIES: phytoene desaturase family protein [Corynebacterium]KAB1502489.1 phytoene desaturase [Corynebacterium sp. 320]KAB1551290.1 phytoene desaturase [Corynebacterium sp. 321]KAB1551882.1 phytoene desaturase [Corynebacterium sp. 319]KAB3526096.1 phytoene desaturase [Corynebacterium sp. 250]KAB3538876.1 phytoene desaturase [Corynebacterium sp. 366]